MKTTSFSSKPTVKQSLQIMT